LLTSVSWRASIVAILAATFILQTKHQWLIILEGTHPYLIGDWTISYAGGFVRRGLSGSLLAGLFSDPADTLIGLWFIQTTLYATVFGVAILWALRLPTPSLFAPLLLSPAFLLFGLNDFSGTQRKEVLVFAGLFLLGESVRSGRFVMGATWAAGALFTVGVFSHEANALLVVPFLLLLRESSRLQQMTDRARDLASGLFLGASGVSLISAILFPGTLEQQQLICSDLLARGFDPNLCEGSLSYIGSATSDQVLRTVNRLPQYLLFLLPATFAALPFRLYPWARENKRVLLLAILPLAPLFFIALDWGRWIMMATVTATVLTVVGSERMPQPAVSVSLPALLLFTTAWSVPHFGISRSSMGPGELPMLALSIIERVLAAAGS
jgi:hypothetical protein